MPVRVQRIVDQHKIQRDLLLGDDAQWRENKLREVEFKVSQTIALEEYCPAYLNAVDETPYRAHDQRHVIHR